MPLLILDRDGVINQDSEDFIRSLDDWHPISGSLEAIADLSRAGYRIAVATNQSGLGRGYFTRSQLEEIHASLCREVEALGGEIQGIFYCPHLPGDACGCRKPATGLLSAIESELGETLLGAPCIGDSLRDLQAARACGCRPILVRTGNGEETLAKLHSRSPEISDPLAIPVYPDLATAAAALLDS
jgi:D-glycero-D-manno-heptose 1,7-bisphosphate phosphatase